MNLDTATNLAQLVTYFLLLPIGAFKTWRKIDERLTKSDSKLARIEYALFNDGRGMEQQIKEIHENQQASMVDIAVLKAKSE